jgi:hypothetical protein
MVELTKQLAQYRAGMDKVNDALKESQELNAKLIEGIGQTVLAYDKVIQSSAKYGRSQKKAAKEAAKAMAKSVDAQKNEISGLGRFIEDKIRAQKGVWGAFHRVMYNVTGYFKVKNSIDVTLSSIDRLISKKKELRAADGKKGFGYFSGEYAKAEEIMNRMSAKRKQLIGKNERGIGYLKSNIAKPQNLVSKKDKKQLLKTENEYGDLFNKITKSEEVISKLKKRQQEAIKLKSKANVTLPKQNEEYEEGNSRTQAELFLLQKKIQVEKAKMGHKFFNTKPIVVGEKTTKAIDNNKAIAKKAKKDKEAASAIAYLLHENENFVKIQSKNLIGRGKVNTAFKSAMEAKGLVKGKDKLRVLKEKTHILKNKPNTMKTNMKNFATYFSGDRVAKVASKVNKKDIKARYKAGNQLVKNAKMADLATAIAEKFGIKKLNKVVKPILEKLGLMAMVVMKSLVIATLTILGLYMLWKASGLKWKNFKAAYETAKEVAIYFGNIIKDGLKGIYQGFLLIKQGFSKGGSLEDVLRGLWKIWVGVFKIIIGVLGLLIGTALTFLGALLWEVIQNIYVKIEGMAETIKTISLAIILVGSIILLILFWWVALPTLIGGWAAGLLVTLVAALVVWAGVLISGITDKANPMNWKMFGGDEKAEGGVVSGGMTLVGEKGPELVNLPAGSRVHSNSQSKRMGVGGNTNNITVNVQGRIGSSDSELRQIAEKVGAMINKEINRTTSSGTMR